MEDIYSYLFQDFQSVSDMLIGKQWCKYVAFMLCIWAYLSIWLVSLGNRMLS